MMSKSAVKEQLQPGCLPDSFMFRACGVLAVLGNDRVTDWRNTGKTVWQKHFRLSVRMGCLENQWASYPPTHLGTSLLGSWHVLVP